MQLTVRDVARLLNVQENAVYRWVKEDQLRAEEVNGQYRFNRSDLLEWATLRSKLVFPPEFFQMGGGDAPITLDKALHFGGIHHNVKGADKESVLRAVVALMPLPPACDRDFLLQVLLTRESLGSTGIGEGIALPHPRYPMVLPVPHPFITLCFLEQPIPYAGGDGQPVHTLFALVSPNVRQHLGLLARLSCALSDPAFRDAVRRQRPGDELLVHACRVEETFAKSPPPQAGAAGTDRPR
jgi:PTS system nitrogen regulatory IIA component